MLPGEDLLMKRDEVVVLGRPGPCSMTDPGVQQFLEDITLEVVSLPCLILARAGGRGLHGHAFS